MISNHWPLWAILMLRGIALALGIGAAGTGLRAARLWHDASLVDVADYDPPLASIGDLPELHIMDAIVQLGAMRDALRSSVRINARAARWTAAGAILAGLGALAGGI